MADAPTITWPGLNGKYKYWVHKLPTNFNEGQDGNYIYTKLVNNVWIPIYIGQGDLADRTNIDHHHQSRCLKSKGATHVHEHTNSREADRTAEEQDLLANFPKAYEPTGCNVKGGG